MSTSSIPPRFRLGPYEPLLELASGGMATVFVARHVAPGGFERLVVLKRVHPHLLKDCDFSNMFRDEARLASQIHHPNVVGVVDVIENDRELFLVMDYVESSALASLMKRVRKEAMRIDPSIAARIVVDTLQGLHAAHEAVDMRGQRLDVVHRDVSPQNIIVGVDGSSRLIDFGIAKAANRLTETRSGSLKGKLGYMSPEGAQGKPVDRRADVFAAGVVLYEAITATRLFAGENDLDTLRRITDAQVPNITSIVPDLPPALDMVLHRALARDAAHRFQTALEFLGAIERVLPLATPRDVATTLERFCGASLTERRNELRGRIDGTIDSVKLARRDPLTESVQSGIVASGPITNDATKIDGTEQRLATSNDLGNLRPRGSKSLIAAGVVVAGMIIAIGATVIVKSSHESATATQAPPATASATAAPVSTAPRDVDLVVTADAPIETLHAKGVHKVELDGLTARVSVAPWDGELPIEVALTGGGLARVVATSGGARSLKAEPEAAAPPEAKEKDTKDEKRPSGKGRPNGRTTSSPSTSPTSPSKSGGELQENPY